MSGEHSELGPSGSDTWFVCAAQPNAARGLPNKSSIYAAEGTCAHTIDELCLLLDIDPDIFVGRKMSADGHEFDITPEWVEFLQPGIDRVRELPGKMYVEYWVDLTHWLGLDSKGRRQGGTLDTGLIGRKEIVIRDLKFGAGVPVSPKRNKQLRLYALGFWWNVARHQTDATDFRIIIDQPRCVGGGGEWTTTLEELLEFGEEARAAANRTRDPDAPFKASLKGCMFCAVKDRKEGCDEYDRFNLETVSAKFDDLDAEDAPVLPRQLTPERRSYVVQHAGLFTKWLEKLHTDTLTDALAGDPTPGLKAVLGRRGNRAWADEKVAETFLMKRLSHDKAFTYSLISPPQAEKILSTADWKALNDKKSKFKMIVQSDGKPTLAPLDDEREAIAATVSKFDNLDDEDAEASDLLG